jgi:hypothetical protein
MEILWPFYMNVWRQNATATILFYTEDATRVLYVIVSPLSKIRQFY